VGRLSTTLQIQPVNSGSVHELASRFIPGAMRARQFVPSEVIVALSSPNLAASSVKPNPVRRSFVTFGISRRTPDAEGPGPAIASANIVNAIAFLRRLRVHESAYAGVSVPMP
jgi:hypothetical protein